MKLAYIFRGIFLLCLFGAADAAALTVSPDLQSTSLIPELRLLEDPGGELDFNRVRSPAYRDRLKPWNRAAANFGYSRSAYWVAFTLRNPTDESVSLLIRQDYPLIDYLDFWGQDAGGNWQRIATGDRRPFHNRPLALRDFVFPVTLPARSERTYYLRYASQGSLNIGLSVSREHAFLARLGLEQLLLGIYYGGFLVLVLYNLFLFIAVRDRAYIYYMAYALSYGLYFAVINGIAFQFAWPDNPWLANWSLIVLVALSLLFATRFAREVCAAAILAPRTDRLARAVQFVLILLGAIAPLAGYRIVVTAVTMIALAVGVLLLAMGSISMLRGSVSARYFMLGWATLIASVIIYVVKTFGWLPHNGYTHNAFQVAALVEMVLLSLALGARVRLIRKRGYIDQLSGLYNRRFFEEQLSREFDLAGRSGTPLSLLMMDLDHFKDINDRHGHHQGDLVIHGIGQLIRNQVRKPVTACRYGGEEFAILLPRTDLAQSRVLAERLVRKVAELEPNGMPLTISAGVADLENNGFSAPVQLLQAADTALYRAKQAGRNRVVTASPEAGDSPGFVQSGKRQLLSP
ncbi:diguanylate cyclase [Microbulbifer halophilus]|uniref:diguanylate cyclase n=1 Tax=Microbulbifer halophilus TaxID=453963 RepID=A0ABW5ED10_9GAMM|nr:diguanylate cyclase [Microbulbifer halophilus]MCW8126600.1 sensor domain-containing diguanylate cyclase [Microbulbifer halophilus]